MTNFALLVVGVVVISMYAFVRLANSSPTASQPSFASVESAIVAGALLYDVRTPAEFVAGHIEYAQNFPLQNLQAGVFPDVPTDQKIYLYCQSGNRSLQAASLLKQRGYTNISDLGGIHDVERSGGKLIQ